MFCLFNANGVYDTVFKKTDIFEILNQKKLLKYIYIKKQKRLSE